MQTFLLNINSFIRCEPWLIFCLKIYAMVLFPRYMLSNTINFHSMHIQTIGLIVCRVGFFLPKKSEEQNQEGRGLPQKSCPRFIRRNLKGLVSLLQLFWQYQDGVYVSAICVEYGRCQSMETLPRKHTNKIPNYNVDFPVYIHFFHSSFSAVRLQIRKMGNQTLPKLCAFVYLHVRGTILWILVKFYTYRTIVVKWNDICAGLYFLKSPFTVNLRLSWALRYTSWAITRLFCWLMNTLWVQQDITAR